MTGTTWEAVTGLLVHVVCSFDTVGHSYTQADESFGGHYRPVFGHRRSVDGTMALRSHVGAGDQTMRVALLSEVW